MQTSRDIARDRQLAKAFIAGDDAAFEALFLRYRDRLIRDARRYVPEDIAEDLVQDVFMWLWTHRTRWTIRTTVRKYLHSAVRNRARDLVARAKTEDRATESYRHILHRRHALGPEDLLLAQELEDAITQGLDTCSPRCRAALLLLLDHPRYADIADHLGIKPGTVQVLIKRGRRRLRAYLGDQGWDEITGRPSAFAVRHRPSHSSMDSAVQRYRHHPLDVHETDPPFNTPFDLAG